ncbi:hypothetical protein SAMN05428969_1655 [Devosia sp. YR412]|uniref:hypothetical protein n=1 Tax=Devosia sp. YR412 TaxID=1881030 RepID=UPI0008BCE9DE|nr:hypothetical protein [Devosia sp. YR412]SEQ03833.1 hypothetical protein SAMN05428969_1655 [Devosia sp. YR412]
MPHKSETILLSKITTLLDDLRREGAENGEAMFLLGAAAANLVDMGKGLNSWADFKAAVTREDIIKLLQQIDAEGNRMLDEDKVNYAYALQIIGMSLAALGSDYPQLQQGGALLDDIIETTHTNYRNYVQSQTDSQN